MKSNAGQTNETPTIREPQVVGWRRRQLLAAGFELVLAEQLARDCSCDLHELIELVEQGCAPALAARILAPLEDERRAC